MGSSEGFEVEENLISTSPDVDFIHYHIRNLHQISLGQLLKFIVLTPYYFSRKITSMYAKQHLDFIFFYLI